MTPDQHQKALQDALTAYYGAKTQSEKSAAWSRYQELSWKRPASNAQTGNSQDGR